MDAALLTLPPYPSAAARAAVEINRKIEDLTVIRESLVQALGAGCDDLVACAGSNCCPLPFVELVTARPGAARVDA